VTPGQRASEAPDRLRTAVRAVDPRWERRHEQDAKPLHLASSLTGRLAFAMSAATI